MSGYAALVDRRALRPTIVDVGPKPYWAIEGPDGDECWLSVSGDDEVVVLDYATASALGGRTAAG